jgi:hypothetical protein
VVTDALVGALRWDSLDASPVDLHLSFLTRAWKGSWIGGALLLLEGVDGLERVGIEVTNLVFDNSHHHSI